MKKDLSDSIFILLNAAANIFWIEDESDNRRKEAQLNLLKASQLGKIFVDVEEEFNYDKFVEICKDLRIINNLRNCKESPIFITYKEYKSIFEDPILIGLENNNTLISLGRYD